MMTKQNPAAAGPRLMRSVAAFLLTLLLAVPASRAQAQEGLDIYFIDVEGGGATLFVASDGESLLIDTGNGGANSARDARRILEAMLDADVSEIDHLITTHWHGDHFGAMERLAGLAPIRHFIDHGPSVEPTSSGARFVSDIYPTLYANAQHTVVTPGDRVPFAGVEVTVLASAKAVIDQPIPGMGRPNPYCADFVPQEEDNGENAQSVGILAQLGEFRLLHLGDLTWNTEFQLMCPDNPIGTVDLWVVSHHGQPISNSPALVHAIESRVAIMNNGVRKGGQPEAMRIIHSAPGLEDLWQLHFSLLSGQEYTVPGMFIANLVDVPIVEMPIDPFVNPQDGGAPPAPTHNTTQAYWIKVEASADGSFTVTNGRNGFSKAYR